MLISNQTYLHGTDGSMVLGAIAGLGVLMLVVLLYIRNKGWWWGTVSGMSCCDEACPPVSSRPVPTPPVPSAISPVPIKNKLVKTYSIEGGGGGGDSSSESETGGGSRMRHGSLGHATAPLRPTHDLMSLVEKGRLGMSSNSSCCSSTTSSVGERHVIDKTAPSRLNDTTLLTRSTVDLRETKIDNQGIDYQKIEAISSCDQIDINSNRDCIVVMNTEGEDKSELMSCGGGVLDEPPEAQMIISKCGHLEIALLYDAPMRKMTVHVLQARDIPSRDRGQPTHTQVRLLLLPSKKQKHKTKIRQGENPQYMESFLLHRVNPEDVNSMGIRLRLYGCERMRRERLIGEAVVSFANINLELENNFWLNLEPRSNITLSGCTGELMSLARSDSTGSTHSMQHGGVPELLLGLCYNATTGRLNVEVVKGSHFRNLSLNRAPDTYVKLILVSSTGQELAQSKTTVRRGQPNPLFKEIFVFQVALFQLADVTLMVSVYNRKGVTKKKEMVGWFSLGLNSSGAEELAHWMDMKEFQQEQICRWHVLVQS
ncbi:synaptotagmin-16 isoform X2 [Aethina tumida]|uniref:synaptotagmin-16 isoform X2 n=1 Tax=Aethina tumida TaxID=116153 RepID=UPI00096B66D1|nr:synaptotagmin-16 isoform X2 [Aethina tumida]